MTACAEGVPCAAEGMTAMSAKEALATLWDDSTRPKLVADALVSLGAEKLLAKVGLILLAFFQHPPATALAASSSSSATRTAGVTAAIAAGSGLRRA